jgi:hypothetical protein
MLLPPRDRAERVGVPALAAAAVGSDDREIGEFLC